MTGESLRALALIFIIPLIMAGKYSEKNAFLIVKDDDIQDVGAAGSWNGLTSRINMSGAFTLEAPSGVDVAAGTVVIVANDTVGALKVTLGGSPFGGADMDVFSIPTKDFASFLYANEDIGFLPLGSGSATVSAT